METTERNRKVITDEERNQLAATLDKDLDDYIAGLERKSYSEGWPEDRWQEVGYDILKKIVCPFYI